MTGRPACAGVDPDLFDYRGGELTEPIPERFYRAARAYCANCPIFTTCDTNATENHDTGLYAGKIRYWKNNKKRSRGYKVENLLKDEQ
jgi:hypothetical protein